MILRARSIVTMDGPPIENGAVVIDGNRISAVGEWSKIKTRHAGEVSDLGENVLLPGLINAHCHLAYTSLRGKIPRPGSFTEWARAMISERDALGEGNYRDSIAEGFAEATKFGTTSIANLEASPQILARLPAAPLRTWWFAELIDVRTALSVSSPYALLQDQLEKRADWVGEAGVAPHAPYTASPALYGEAAEISRRENVLLTTHLAESRDEMRMFRDGEGPLFDFMKSVGRPMSDCGLETPLAYVRTRTPIDSRWIVAHLNELTEDDFLSLARADRFHVVHCPRSHRYFGHTPFAFARLRDLGFNISLGTDSLASNDDLSLFGEMRAFLERAPEVSPEEAFSMVTLNPALALGQAKALGRISPHFYADLIAIPFDSAGTQLFDHVVTYEGEVPFSMVNGRVIHNPF